MCIIHTFICNNCAYDVMVVFYQYNGSHTLLFDVLYFPCALGENASGSKFVLKLNTVLSML